MLLQRLLALVTFLLNLRHGCCVCYFPGELQGVWATQRSTSLGSSRAARSPISYQEVTIEADMILQWGMCHARADNNVILMDSTGGSKCYRCVYLNVASPKVVQVWTMGLETCYTSEEAALSTCPPSQAMASRRAREIMLYKIRGPWGEPDVLEVECPLNGRYSFTYRRGHNGISTAHCKQPTSEFSNCPYGFGFSVKYRECSFVTPLITGLQCLGAWVGEDGEDYLAVMDTSVQEGQDAPKFKCGIFREEAGTGRVFIAFSEDSTCTNSLTSSTDGYETYELTSIPTLPLPPSVSQATCTFPRSLMGHWHHTYVADDTVVFKDYRNFMTYSARCVKDLSDGERYIVYARTHCGDWTYNCLWLKRRSANVLEFMLGLYPRETFDDRLCDADKFGDMTSWTTQGKSLLEEPVTCPIIGNYAGELPDANGICAQLYSDCKDPQIMYYTVSTCINSSAVYEREDLSGPTSEAGPWLPPEQKVSTGAVLTIVDDAGGRGRRQASNGRLRVANARTTTISWLWGSSTKSDTTTTTSATTTTTTSSTTSSPPPVEPDWPRPPFSEPPSVIDYPSAGRDYDRRINPDPFLEDKRPQPNVPRPGPPRQDGYDTVGFWPGNRNQPEYTVGRESPVPPPIIVPGFIKEISNEEDSDVGGVPGRATWVPGAPPGFHSESSSTRQPFSSETGPSFPQKPQAHVPSSSIQTSTSSNSDGHPYLPTPIANRQPLKQEREYQCLGQWKEEGRVYALTYRRDIRVYECFVGVIKPNGVVFIKEAGSVCSRGVQPEVLGMKLHRKGEACPQAPPSSSQASQSSQREDSRPRTIQPPWLRTTRPWKPITGGQILVTCKVGKVCFNGGKNQDAFEDQFSIFMERLTGKGKFFLKDLQKMKINNHHPNLILESSDTKKIMDLRSMKHKNGITSVWHYAKSLIAKRKKRDTVGEKSEMEPDIKQVNNTDLVNLDHDTSFMPDKSDSTGTAHIHDPVVMKEETKIDLSTTSSKDIHTGEYIPAKTHDAYEEHIDDIQGHLCNFNCSILDDKTVNTHQNEDASHKLEEDYLTLKNHIDSSDTSTWSNVPENTEYFTTEHFTTQHPNENVTSHVKLFHVDQLPNNHVAPTDHDHITEGHTFSSVHDTEHFTSQHPNENVTSHVKLFHVDQLPNNHVAPTDHDHITEGHTFSSVHDEMHSDMIATDIHDNSEVPIEDNHTLHSDMNTTLLQDKSLSHLHDSHTIIELHQSDNGNIHTTKSMQDSNLNNSQDMHLELRNHGDHLNNDHEVITSSKKAIRSHHLEIHENITHMEKHSESPKTMAHKEDKMHVVIHNDGYNETHEENMMDDNISSVCSNLTDNETLSSAENMTDIIIAANCSGEWMEEDNSTTEMMYTTTDDSDIPKIPISLIEYPTLHPTTVKPPMVTFPPMMWQPFAQPGTNSGRPRHHGSGSRGISTTSQPLLIVLLVSFYIFVNYV